VERGLDFLAVTDHNTVSHHALLASASARYGVTLVPGQEVTTAYGHANVFGDTGWIDFRWPADEWLAAAEAGGGLMSVNHPIAGPVSWMHPMGRRPPLVEVWHWSWLDLSWTTPLAWWQAWSPDAIPVGGSDWHLPGNDKPLGVPTTWVEAASAEPDGILEALDAGRVAITAGREGPSCCGTTANWSRSARTGWSWPARPAATGACAATGRACPGARATTACSPRPGTRSRCARDRD
jgi:hypothetical protein